MATTYAPGRFVRPTRSRGRRMRVPGLGNPRRRQASAHTADEQGSAGRRWCNPAGGKRLATAGAGLASAVLTGCGFRLVRRCRAPEDADTLTFTTWGTDAELAGFRDGHRRLREGEPRRHGDAERGARTSRCSPTSTPSCRPATRPTSSASPTTPSAPTPGAGQLLDLSHAPARRLRRPLHPARPGRRCRTAASRTACRTTPTPR